MLVTRPALASARTGAEHTTLLVLPINIQVRGPCEVQDVCKIHE